jgi:hypothetical protein
VLIFNQSGKLKRKPSGGERAWFLEEESEPRNKLVCLAGENQRADVSASPTELRFFFSDPGRETRNLR